MSQRIAQRDLLRSSLGTGSPLARSSNPRITLSDLRDAQRLRVSTIRSTVVSGQVGRSDRNDLFRFFVPERSQVLVTIRRSNRNINTTILNGGRRLPPNPRPGTILPPGPGSTLLGVTNSGPTEDEIFITDLARGAYFLRVFSRLGRTNYRVTLTVRPNNAGGNIGDDGGVPGGGTTPTPTPGTQLFRDINLGRTGSDPTDLTVNGNTLYFAANNGFNGRELFRVNQGSNATQQIIVNPSASEDATPQNFASLNNSLFFSATNGFNGRQLYEIVNNANSATRVSAFNLVGAGANPSGLTVFNNLVFFAADGVGGRELYRSDGTTQGTFRVADINPGVNGSNPTDFAVVGNRLYFAADNGFNGRELYSTDGTAAGTTLVADLNSGGIGINADSSIPTDLVNLNNVLYFAATGDGTVGRQLWRFDPAVGINSLSQPISTNILNGTVGSSPGTDFSTLISDDPTSVNTFLSDRPNRNSAIVAVGNELYFAATSSVSNRQLYRSDGTTAGTEIAVSISTGGNSLNPTSLTNINGVLYFAGTSSVFGTEPYRFNPATAQSNNTQPNPVSDVNPGSTGSDPSNFVLFGNRVVFVATTAVVGRELWSFTPTA